MPRKGHFPAKISHVSIQGKSVEVDTLVGIMDRTTGAIMHHMPLNRARLFCISQAVMGDNRFVVVMLKEPKKGSRRKGFVGGWRHIGDEKADAIRRELDARPEVRGKSAQIARDLDVSVRIVYNIKHGKRWVKKVDNHEGQYAEKV